MWPNSQFAVDLVTFTEKIHNRMGRRNWGQGGRTFFGAKIFARKIKSDEMEGVDGKGNKKWYKEEGVQPKNYDAPHTNSFMYLLL